MRTAEIKIIFTTNQLRPLENTTSY